MYFVLVFHEHFAVYVIHSRKDQRKKRVIQVQTLMESERKKNFCSTKLASIHAITHSLYIFSRNTVSHNFISKFLFLYITCQFFLFHFTSLATRHIKMNIIQKHSENLHNTTKELIFRARDPAVQNLRPPTPEISTERIIQLAYLLS